MLQMVFALNFVVGKNSVKGCLCNKYIADQINTKKSNNFQLKFLKLLKILTFCHQRSTSYDIVFALAMHTN